MRITSYRVALTVLLLWTALLPAGCLRAPYQVVSAIPPGVTTWQGEVRIAGDVVVPAEATLRILPGSEVVFLPADERDLLRDHPHFPGSELIVRGRLDAQGTPLHPIRFRFLVPDAPRGSWGGINLVDSPGAKFAYCSFTQADSALHSQGSEVVVEESLFEDNLVAIRFHSSAIRIERNLIRNNGTGLRFHYGAPRVSNNLFLDNDKGVFITSEPRDVFIRDNVFIAQRRYSVVLGEEVTEDVDLRGNWWGGLDPDVISAAFFDVQRDPVLGKVLFLPALSAPPAVAGPAWNR